MKKWISILNIFALVGQAFSADVILTKQGRKYHGKVIRMTEKGFVVRTVEGSVIVIPKQNVTKIYRDNKVLDFEEGMSYYLEVRRPFLPFVALSVVSGIYAVGRINDYKEKQNEADQLEAEARADYLKKSNQDLAMGIVAGLFSVGSFIIAIRPMEVRVPIGRINLSATSRGVTLALHF